MFGFYVRFEISGRSFEKLVKMEKIENILIILTSIIWISSGSIMMCEYESVLENANYSNILLMKTAIVV